MENASTPYRVIPVVSPASADPNTSGRVRNLHVGGGVFHKQLSRAGNTWLVESSYERAGWRLLEDCYREERDEAGWERYKRYLDHWAKGLTSSTFPEEWLPRFVQDRRKGHAVDEFARKDEYRVKPTTGDTTPPTPRGKRGATTEVQE